MQRAGRIERARPRTKVAADARRCEEITSAAALVQQAPDAYMRVA
jgi:hypothetical protein